MTTTTSGSEILVCVSYALIPHAKNLPDKGSGYALYSCDICKASMWVAPMGQLLWEKWRQRICVDCAYRAGLVDERGRPYQ